MRKMQRSCLWNPCPGCFNKFPIFLSKLSEALEMQKPDTYWEGYYWEGFSPEAVGAVTLESAQQDSRFADLLKQIPVDWIIPGDEYWVSCIENQDRAFEVILWHRDVFLGASVSGTSNPGHKTLQAIFDRNGHLIQTQTLN